MARAAKQDTDSRTERDTGSKGVLFCPDCSHQSQYDGDWLVVRSGQRSRYLCPDCRTEITSRPSLQNAHSRFDTYDPWQMWGTSVRLMQKMFWM